MPPPKLKRPSDLEGRIPEVELRLWREPLYRIQDSVLLHYRRHPSARYRFDAPDGQYATLYANDSRVGVFGEVYVNRGHRLGPGDAERRLIEITPSRALPLVDLRDDRTLATLDLDARISVGDDYEACQQWALAIHERWSEACGICYAARAGGIETTNVALFAERCFTELRVNVLGRLADLEELLLTAADRYRLRAPFLT